MNEHRSKGDEPDRSENRAESANLDDRLTRRTNLNLMFALYAILRARTLTEAARMVSLSQPAMSLSLKKLRAHYSDKLVIYGKNGRRLTSLATALQPKVGRVLREASALFEFDPVFDPTTLERTVVLAAPEALEITYLAQAASHILNEASRIRVRLANYGDGELADLFDNGVDIAVVPEPLLDPTMGQLALLEIGLTCLVWDGHPISGDKMTEAEYRSARHAGMLETSEALSMAGITVPDIMTQRNLVVRTDQFAALANLIVGTDLVVTTNTWLAQQMAFYHPLRLISVPFEAGRVRMFAQWELHRTDDPLIKWLLNHLLAAR